jgi:hypothetical protein
VLLKGASYRGESVIGIRANETNRANDQDQDHGEHHRILGNVLASIVRPELGEETAHDKVPFFEIRFTTWLGVLLWRTDK